MACLIVPVVEALALTLVARKVRQREEQELAVKAEAVHGEAEKEGKIPFSRKLKWLTNMLWGGSALLLFEHVWHGEIVPWFPFLTAAESAAETSAMLYEMATVGVCMAVLVTAVWGLVLLVVHSMEKNWREKQPETQQAAN